MYVLGGLSLLVLVLSKLFNVVEWFFRWNADRGIEATDNEINRKKGELNEIHEQNITNVDEYLRAKREYESNNANNGKKDQ